ncbi:hypothetical protein GTY88_22195, partial [Streptomyces sp. SID5926]|nr:hypothetical protein [Streptomyces sp. SID5926]
MTACGASTSTVVASARFAMKRRLSVPMVRSSVGTRYQDGMVCHATARVGSLPDAAVAGRWVAASTSTRLASSRSLRKTSPNFSGLRYRSTFVASPPSGTAFSAVGTGAFGSSVTRLPGAHGPAEFWRLLRSGTDAVTEPPPDRSAIARRGAFLDDITGFDAGFFGVFPQEAAAMDP